MILFYLIIYYKIDMSDFVGGIAPTASKHNQIIYIYIYIYIL